MFCYFGSNIYPYLFAGENKGKKQKLLLRGNYVMTVLDQSEFDSPD